MQDFFLLKLMQSHTHTHTHTWTRMRTRTRTRTRTAHKQKGTNTAEALKSHTYTLKVVIHLRCQWQHLSMVYVCAYIHKVSTLITLLNTAYYFLREMTHCISSDLGLSFDSSSDAPISLIIYWLVPMCLFPVIAFQLFEWTLNLITTLSLNVHLWLLSLSFCLFTFVSDYLGHSIVNDSLNSFEPNQKLNYKNENSCGTWCHRNA